MQLRVEFACLRIPDTWPDSVEALLRIVDQHLWILPSHVGYNPATIIGILSPQDAVDACLTERDVVIKVALLSLPFFQQCAVDEIVDMHSNPPRPLPCPTVQRLVERLTRALLDHEDTLSESTTFVSRRPQVLAAYLRHLEWAQDIYIRQYQRRRLTYRPVTPDQIKNADGVYTLMLEALDVPHYMEGWHFDPTLLCNELIHEMRHVFQDRIAWPRTYHRSRSACIDYWIALILKRFGVEEGKDEEQIMRRFRKRLYRKH